MKSINKVALRKESVDRNSIVANISAGAFASLSARRAWIEICSSGIGGGRPPCRSPQGERG